MHRLMDRIHQNLAGDREDLCGRASSHRIVGNRLTIATAPFSALLPPRRRLSVFP